jgi:hypothetical protein
MHNELVKRGFFAALLAIAPGCSPAVLSAQEMANDALTAVEEAMAYRRGPLGDSLPFDACSVFQQTGRPRALLSNLSPGLHSLLDRRTDDPCSIPQPGERRHERWARVDSVVVKSASAEVYLHIRRDGWQHDEVYFLTPRASGGWALREVRMFPGLHTSPPSRS